MATLDEFAYNIRNIARQGRGTSDDDKLRIKQIKFWIQGYRAKGLNLATDYGKKVDPQMVQDLGVVPLVEVDKADSSCPAVTWGCKIKKASIEIPKFVDFPDNRAVMFVGKIDKQTPLDYNQADVHKFKASTRFGHKRSKCYLIGNTLYVDLIEEDREMEYINIRGVFENPEKVFSFATEGCDAKCYDPAKDEYPMPMSMYQYVLSEILQRELNMTLQTTSDELNNARQDNAKIG